MHKALIVFAKVPRPGEVKTRLSPVLTPEESAHLYRAFLRDALDQYQRLRVDVRLYLAGMEGGPENGEPDLDGLPDDIRPLPQSGDGLGKRMNNAFQETFAAGYDRACVIGTDHPTLPSGFVRQAFKSLDAASSICIGPSDDGGFYLLGMSQLYPVLFENMTYSHGRVFSNTLARASSTRARLTVLPRWYDVDTPETLRRMIGDLIEQDAAAPHTREAVRDLQLMKIAT